MFRGFRETSQFLKDLSCLLTTTLAEGIENWLGLPLKLIGSFYTALRSEYRKP